MVGAALPDWVDPEMLRWIILVVIAVLLYAMYVVTRFVRHLVVKVILFSLLAGLGLSLWIQREDLQNCAQVCECRLYGQEIVVPLDRCPIALTVDT